MDRGLGDALPDDCAVWALTGTTPQRGDMAEVIRAAAVPVIVGGPHATAVPEHVLAMGEVTVVCGEGEEVLPRLLSRPLLGSAIVHADRIRDLDALPFPDRGQAHRYHYTITDRYGVEREATTAITSRGCPHQCAFCSHAVWQRRHTARSAENVLAELWGIREQYGAVHFYDDSLAIDRRRLHAICTELRDMDMAWRCFVRADQVDLSILLGMADAGCVEIGLGVESGADSVLTAVHKGETVAQQADAIRWAQQAGIRVKAFMIVGLPGETWGTLDQTADFLAVTEPDDVDVTVLQVYPGSPIHDDFARYGLARTGGPCWYKGRRGEYRANHRTQVLSADDLLVARDYLEARFKRRAA